VFLPVAARTFAVGIAGGNVSARTHRVKLDSTRDTGARLGFVALNRILSLKCVTLALKMRHSGYSCESFNSDL